MRLNQLILSTTPNLVLPRKSAHKVEQSLVFQIKQTKYSQRLEASIGKLVSETESHSDGSFQVKTVGCLDVYDFPPQLELTLL